MNDCERLRESKIQNTAPRVYLNPMLAKFVENSAKLSGLSKSRIIENAVREKFNAMPEQERQRILNQE